jgi:phage terminase large subunit
VKRLIEDKIRELGVEDYFDIRLDKIRSRHGNGVILFYGLTDLTADNIKSLEGMDAVFIEEAQTISKASIEKLRPTIRRQGSEIMAIWNPDCETDPIDQLLRGSATPPDALVVEVNHQDNPWFTDALQMEMEYDRKNDTEQYLHVWEGHYRKHAEAAVFKNWEVRDFKTPKNAVLRFGGDFGYGGEDATGAVRCFLEGRELFIDYEAYEVACEIDDTPSLFMTIPDAEKYPIRVDGAHPDRIKHLVKHGFTRMRAAVKGPGSVEAGIKWLKNYHIVVHPRCRHMITELKLFRHKIDPVTGEVLPTFEKKNNHLISATRYACEEVRRIEDQKPSNVVYLPIASRWNRAA